MCNQHICVRFACSEVIWRGPTSPIKCDRLLNYFLGNCTCTDFISIITRSKQKPMIHKRFGERSWMIFLFSDRRKLVSPFSTRAMIELSCLHFNAILCVPRDSPRLDNEILEDNLRAIRLTEKSFATANEIFNEMWLKASHYRIINLIWKRRKNILRSVSSVQLRDRRTCIKMLLLSLRELGDKRAIGWWS